MLEATRRGQIAQADGRARCLNDITANGGGSKTAEASGKSGRAGRQRMEQLL